MTRIHLLLLCALALGFGACEMHPASQLADSHGADPGHAAAAKHDPAAPHDSKPADAGAAHGEAPKFFPEKK